MSKKSRRILVLATNNLHKVGEIKGILKNARLNFQIKTLSDFPKRRPVVENKPTLEGNAIKKAKEISKWTNCLALSDDTGLFIKALKGRPGVYSARFAGPRCNFEDNNHKVLRLMKKTPPSKRSATFRCVAALALPSGAVVLAQGKINGKIVSEMQGGKGFGYDPIFYVHKYKKTFAQMKLALKNKISHRARAFSKIPRLLRKSFKIIK